jgi:hypothetical protein
MNYTMKITADHDMTEDERLDVLDPLGDTFDSASMGKRVIEVDGSMRPTWETDRLPFEPSGTVASAETRLAYAAEVLKVRGYAVEFSA